MKNLKLMLLGMMLTSGSIFAMEEGETSKTDAVLNQLPTALNQLSIDPQEDLLAGIEANDPEQVRIALAAGADPKELAAGNQYPLCLAIVNGFFSVDLCKLPNLLLQSSLNKSLQIIRLLLEAGANPKYCLKKTTYDNKFYGKYYSALSSFFVTLIPAGVKRYSVAKLLYNFGDRLSEDEPLTKFSRLNGILQSNLKSESSDRDLLKTLLLLLPNINAEEFGPHQECVQEIQNEVRSDLLDPIQKKSSTVLNYLQQRELGIRIPKKSKKVVSNGKQETNSNDNNSQ